MAFIYVPVYVDISVFILNFLLTFPAGNHTITSVSSSSTTNFAANGPNVNSIAIKDQL